MSYNSGKLVACKSIWYWKCNPESWNQTGVCELPAIYLPAVINVE